MKSKHINSTASKFTILRQLCNLIPSHLVSRLARRHHSEADARPFSHWSHVVSLIYSKLTHSFGLNDVCDALGLYSGSLSSIRGARAPKRNTLSHANRERPAAIAEGLFWGTLEQLRHQSPGFGRRRFPGPLRQLKRTIHLLDSTVIELVANCLDWAAHRRRKAAAKCHVRLNFETLLPGCPELVVRGREEQSIRHGQSFELAQSLRPDRGQAPGHAHAAPLLKILNGERKLVAVARHVAGSVYHPGLVIG